MELICTLKHLYIEAFGIIPSIFQVCFEATNTLVARQDDFSPPSVNK